MRKWAGLNCIALEPIKETYFFMRWNLYENMLPSWNASRMAHGQSVGGVVAINKAIGINSSDVSFWSDPNSSRGSCAEESLSPTLKALRESNSDRSLIHTVVPGISLSQILADYNISKISLIRMDCEGCEYSIIPAWHRAGLIPLVQHWSYEVHPVHARRFPLPEVKLTYHVLMNATSTKIQLHQGSKHLGTIAQGGHELGTN